MPDLTVKDVATELKTSPWTVRSLIASGELRAYRLHGDRSSFRIRPDALAEYRERRERMRDPWVPTRLRRIPARGA
jgi:excisionase family DNA binding protein